VESQNQRHPPNCRPEPNQRECLKTSKGMVVAEHQTSPCLAPAIVIGSKPLTLTRCAGSGIWHSEGIRYQVTAPRMRLRLLFASLCGSTATCSTTIYRPYLLLSRHLSDETATLTTTTCYEGVSEPWSRRVRVGESWSLKNSFPFLFLSLLNNFFPCFHLLLYGANLAQRDPEKDTENLPYLWPSDEQ
jgi:hypothetical protein